MSRADIPMTLALAGRGDEAQARLAALPPQSGITTYEIAMVRMALGDRQAALAGLEQALAEADTPIRFLKADPTFAALRGEARFQALLDRLGVL